MKSNNKYEILDIKKNNERYININNSKKDMIGEVTLYSLAVSVSITACLLANIWLIKQMIKYADWSGVLLLIPLNLAGLFLSGYLGTEIYEDCKQIKELNYEQESIIENELDKNNNLALQMLMNKQNKRINN